MCRVFIPEKNLVNEKKDNEINILVKKSGNVFHAVLILDLVNCYFIHDVEKSRFTSGKFCFKCHRTFVMGQNLRRHLSSNQCK